jgi:hypothetical protein
MEMFFQESLRLTTQRYDQELHQVPAEGIMLPNEDIDTGALTKFGEYELADETYAQLVDKLASRKFGGLTASLRTDILRFYAGATSDSVPPKDKKGWEKTQKELDQLKNESAGSDVPPATSGIGHPGSE